MSMSRDTLCVAGQDVPMAWVRDRRSRRLHLTVSERGARLSIPVRVSDAVAHAFVADHAPWIAAQWQRFRDTQEPVQWAFGAVQVLPLAGETLAVDWEVARSARVEKHADGLRFYAPEHASAAALRRALTEFYAAEARACVGRWLPSYLEGLPRPPVSFRFRALSSLWGSLSPDSRVSLDLSLVLGPWHAFEYVLVHELCHLVQANHSPAFWAEVERRWPPWREARSFLRGGQGLALKSQWRALLG